jgi:predicted phage-related endonuclease
MTFNRYRIHKEPHGSQAWLDQRYMDEQGNRRISASAAAAIYGLHPFVKKDHYAAEQLSGVAPSPITPNAAMETGNRLEDTIISWSGDRLGVEFETPKELFCYDTDKGCHLISTLDGWNEETRHILEVKTTSREYSGTLPDYWRIQGITQYICADAKRVTWAIFDNTLRLTLVEQVITEEEVAEHIEAVTEWLNSVELGMTPSGVRWSYETIQTRYQRPVSRSVELPSETADLIQRLRHVRSELASYKQMEDELKAEVCELLGEADTAILNGVTVATWKGQKRESFDSKALRLAHPDLAKQYIKEVHTRTFLLKGEK